MTLVTRVHGRGVHGRRVRVLARHLAELIPRGAAVLDVGSGDGLLASQVLAARPDLAWRALDTHPRPHTHVPVELYDGRRLPLAAKSTDVVVFVDVLHHADDPRALLADAVRVARRALVVKDHLREGWLAAPTLRFMDWVGNAGWGVSLPYHYWSAAEWAAARAELGLALEDERTDLGLYPRWADWLFGRSLHFAARFGLAAR